MSSKRKSSRSTLYHAPRRHRGLPRSTASRTVSQDSGFLNPGLLHAHFQKQAILEICLEPALTVSIGLYRAEIFPVNIVADLVGRSEERRVGKECRSRW